METPSCGDCTLVLDSILVLGSADGPDLIASEFTSVTRDRRGRYYVNSGYSTALKVFDEHGTFITLVGGEGDGPGEFGGIATVHHGAGDTLYILDSSNMRGSVISPSYEIIRSHPLEIRPEKDGAIRFSDGRFVLASPVSTPALAGQPLHLLDPTGRRLESFGSTATDPDRSSGSTLRLIAKAGESAVWSAYSDRYRLERWELGSALDDPVVVLDREVDWFTPVGEPSHQVSGAPRPAIGGIQVDSVGRLLVIGLVPDDDWSSAVRGPVDHPAVISWDVYYDSVLDLLNPETGEVLASVRSPHLLRFVDENLVSAVISDEAGVPYVHVWSIEFHD